MSYLLLAIGVGLILFGAVVLLRYSDRPGGTLRWLGLEVSSKGAGLPLIVLGIGCIAFAVAHPSAAEREARGDSAAPLPAGRGGAVSGCFASLVGSVPADRVMNVEAGMRDLDVISPPQPLDAPFSLLFTENGEPIGAVRLRLYRGSDSSSHLFKVEAAMDAACRPAAIRNATRSGDPRNLVNWDTLRLRLGATDYDLRVGASETIRVNFTRGS
jgi:hypothetical protein